MSKYSSSPTKGAKKEEIKGDRKSKRFCDLCVDKSGVQNLVFKQAIADESIKKPHTAMLCDNKRVLTQSEL